jgi:hypothetical protein
MQTDDRYVGTPLACATLISLGGEPQDKNQEFSWAVDPLVFPIKKIGELGQ